MLDPQAQGTARNHKDEKVSLVAVSKRRSLPQGALDAPVPAAARLELNGPIACLNLTFDRRSNVPKTGIASGSHHVKILVHVAGWCSK